MTLLRTVALVGLWLLCCSSGNAQDARVRAQLESKDPLWVGQRITLVLELMAPGYFSSAVNFDLPDPQGVLLMPPSGSPVIDSSTVDGVRYTVQRHKLNAWAMRDGGQSIPAITARFAFKRHPLDKDEVRAEVTSTEIPLKVQRPPGTDGLGIIISARMLTVNEHWQPEPDNTETVQAGAAFTRTVTFSAPDVPGMIFPIFAEKSIDGLGVYARHQVLDENNRGTLTGKSQNTITYLTKRPGQFTIPAVRFRWFDIDRKQLQSVDLPAHTLNVVANPAMPAVEGGAHSTATSTRYLGGLLATVLLLLLLATVCNRRLRSHYAKLLAPLRPVHLEPLNPTEGKAGHRPYKR